MWSYYGSKSKIAKYYPKPEYDLILEPFAGSAWYSVLHRRRSVILNEKNHTIYKLWKWLIQDANTKELLKNKDLHIGQDISRLSIAREHKDLLGFCINRGSISPTNIVQKWSCQVKHRPDWASTVAYRIEKISSLLPEIKHWSSWFGDYLQLPNIECTWFIDPPYESSGHLYTHSTIDFRVLAEWCKSRTGQVIVCENSRSEQWLPFEPLEAVVGQARKSVEYIWTNQS